MSQVKGQVIRQRQDRKCPWAAILITKISVADNRVGISSQWCRCASTTIYKDWLVASLINQVGSTCAAFLFSVSFSIACWLLMVGGAARRYLDPPVLLVLCN